MSQLALPSPCDTECKLCWANRQLTGGHVIAEGPQFYVYAFEKGGEPDRAFIATKAHHSDMTSLAPGWGEEFSSHYGQLEPWCNQHASNIYWSTSAVAGRTIGGHWHLNVLLRKQGMPSSFMGPAMVLDRFDRLVLAIESLAQHCDPHMAERLYALVANAKHLPHHPTPTR